MNKKVDPTNDKSVFVHTSNSIGLTKLSPLDLVQQVTNLSMFYLVHEYEQDLTWLQVAIKYIYSQLNVEA